MIYRVPPRKTVGASRSANLGSFLGQRACIVSSSTVLCALSGPHDLKHVIVVTPFDHYRFSKQIPVARHVPDLLLGRCKPSGPFPRCVTASARARMRASVFLYFFSVTVGGPPGEVEAWSSVFLSLFTSTSPAA